MTARELFARLGIRGAAWLRRGDGRTNRSIEVVDDRRYTDRHDEVETARLLEGDAL